MDIKPTRTRIRMYQVGFGDCFLLTFEYPRALPDGRRERHMLVDFGTTRLPKALPRLEDTARLILEHTGNELDVLVVTHRHRDHLQGFGDAESGPLTEKLKPKLVMRPWTEDPKLAADAEAPGSSSDARVRLVQGIRTGQELAKAIDSMAKAAGDERLDLRSPAGTLAAEAEDQVKNAEAIARLDGFAEKSYRHGIYASFGSKVPFEKFIPGVTCEVLGPPTIKMSRDVLKQRSNDPGEFWLDTMESAAASKVAQITGDQGKQWDLLTQPGGLGSARWLLENLAGHQQAALLRLVRLVDDALNNTSLILLLTVGGSRRLLLPGDAQIENWSYVLNKTKGDEALRERLAEVDLYKVGHHGSRNATPKTLFNMWNEPATKSRRMTALMSTLPGVHGKTEETRVPRETLITALNERMTLRRTDELGKKPFVEVVGPTTGRGGFELVEG